MIKRSWYALLMIGLLLLAGTAHAGSYLDRASLLVDQSKQESAYLRKHLSDTELARMVHYVCLGRVRAARDMHVPKEVQLAHPHIMLMLESYERAADAAINHSAAEFLKFTRRAQDEEQIFRSILAQSGWTVPAMK